MFLHRLRGGALRVFAQATMSYAKLARVSAYTSVVLGGLLLFGAHSARGAIGEQALSLGRELDGMRDMLGSTKAVDLNGQRMMLSTAVVPLGVSAALDRFERACERGPHSLAQAVDADPEAHALAAKLPRRTRLGIMRSEDAREGMVACIVRRSDQDVPLATLVEGLARTMDIGHLGDFFYVYVKDATHGETTQTHVITAWTHGSFKPGEMFPATGDAPGTDSTSAARPAHARRILSGLAVGAPYGLRVYESTDNAATALTAFDTDMAARGWTKLEAACGATAPHAYMHSSGVQAIATATLAHESDNTIVSLVEMGAADRTALSTPAR